jgi:ABC-type multidrug transport system fused ATPase/permease subunit
MTKDVFFSIAAMFVVPLFAVLVPIFIGQRYGVYRSKKTPEKETSSVSTIASAALGLLAFLLAFTFQIAVNRYTDRKEMLINEVTTIRTAYLRSGLVPEPFRTETRKYLIEYTDLRVELAKNISMLDKTMMRTEEILDTLWNYSERIAEQDRSSEAYSLYISSVNDLVEKYNQRVTISLEYRIPESVLYTLCIITFLSMFTLGYQIGLSGKASLKLSILLGVIFAIIIFLILALDRPELGLTRLNQQPMLKLQQQLQESVRIKQ